MDLQMAPGRIRGLEMITNTPTPGCKLIAHLQMPSSSVQSVAVAVCILLKFTQRWCAYLDLVNKYLFSIGIVERQVRD